MNPRHIATGRALCFFAVLVTLPPAANAQTYPSKAVRIILPYLGSTEFVGRWIATKLSAALGQQVIVDPHPGAGGKIGHDLHAKSAPDGYTLMLAAPPLVINPLLTDTSGRDPLRDITPIAVLGTIPYVLAVHPSVPVKNLRELVKLARGNPGKLSYGSGAPGSPSHLAGELLKSQSQANILLVPYKGATFALVGAMSGEVDIVISAASAVVNYVNDKRMRALAVLNTKPVDSLPGLPTAAEAGMPQLLVNNWFVLAAPKGTPPMVIERLNTEATKIMQATDTRRQMTTLGGDIMVSNPDQATAFLRDEYMRWGRVIREANIKAD